MSDEPAASINNVSGGINLNGDATIGSDAVGRDKVTNVGGDYIQGDKIVYTASLLRATPSAPPAHFTGREADLTKFTQLLTSGASVAITALHGIGGIGKTTLAQKLAEQIADHFPGGVLWWTLGPNPDVITALDVWARHAEPNSNLKDYPTAEARAEAVRPLLVRLGQLCVIIDDVWDARSARILLAALPPDSVVVITTRNAQLAGGLGCHVERIDRLSPEECLTLLGKLFEPHALGAYENAAKDIIKIVDRLPLALKLIRGLADTPARLPRVVEKLRKKPMLDILKLPDDEGREASLEWCLALSYTERLNADMQRRFRALGAFARAPYDRAAIAAVWDETDVDAVADAVEYLIQRNLLEEDEAAQEYSQHALLRAYALGLLEKENEHGAVGSRHAACYRAFAKQQPWRTVEHFFDQIDHGWQWVQANAPEQIIDYVFTIQSFLKTRGRSFEALNWLNIGLAQVRALNAREQEGVLLNDIASAQNALGQIDKALDCYQQALTIHREVGNRLGEGTTLNNIGYTYHVRGQMHEALDTYQQALAICREVGDRSGEGTTLNNIGEVYRARGQMKEALDFYKEALDICREMGDRFAEGTTLNNIGLIYKARGQMEEALDTYQQALAIHREVGDRLGEGSTLNNIGLIYNARGQLQEALDTYQQALAIRREVVGGRLGEGSTLNNIGLIYKARGQMEEALDTYQQALVIHREVGNRTLEGTTLNNIGMIYNARGQMEEALNTYQQALAIHREVGDRSGEGTTLNNIGAIYQARGQMEEALDTFQQALVIIRELGDVWHESMELFNIGILLDEMERTAEAVTYLEHCVTLMEALGHPYLEDNRATLEQVRAKLAAA